MDAIEKRALDLLISECMVAFPRVPEYFTREEAVRAVVRALTPPEGWVLVPMTCTDEMYDAALVEYPYDNVPSAAWEAMIAARPKVPNDND